MKKNLVAVLAAVVMTTAVGFIMYSKSRFGRRLSNGYTI